MADEHNEEESRHVHLEGGMAIFTPALHDPSAHEHADRIAEQTYKTQNLSLQRRLYWTQVALVAFSVISAGVSLCAVAVNLWQTSIARDSSEIAQKSVLLAQKTERDSRLISEKQLRASRAQYEREQRPWVSLTGFKVQLSPRAAIIPNLTTTDEAVAGFQNSGHTPARNVHGFIGFGFKDRKRIMNSEDERWMADQISIQRRGSGGRKDWWLSLKSEGINSYRPWGKLVMGSIIMEPISLGVVGPGATVTYRRDNDWHAGKDIQYDAFLFGEVTYLDDSSAVHITRFCVYRPDNVGDIFDACPVFNDMH